MFQNLATETLFKNYWFSSPMTAVSICAHPPNRRCMKFAYWPDGGESQIASIKGDSIHEAKR
jgi:hypothetical protein